MDARSRFRIDLIVLQVLSCVFLAAGAPARGQTAYVGATLWDGTGADPVPDAVLVVDDRGIIVSAGEGAPPPGATVVDLAGRWITPGLINAHGHVTGRWAPDGVSDPGRRLLEDLALYARYGVTTVASLGDSDDVIRLAREDAREREGPVGAHLLAAGAVITATDPAEAAEVAAARVRAGADWVKFRVDDNLGTSTKMPMATAGAILDRAHREGARVATHLFYLEDAKALLREGTDLIAHSVRDRPADEELARLMIDRGVCYVPTLTREVSTFVYGSRPDFFDDPFFQAQALQSEVERVSRPAYRERIRESRSAALYREALDQALENLRLLSEAGVTIAMGTDSGPGGRFPGYFEHLELRMMVDAGLTPKQALTAATRDAAACLGIGTGGRFGAPTGTLEEGHLADFLVLGADPLAEIGNTSSVERVFVAGREVR